MSKNKYNLVKRLLLLVFGFHIISMVVGLAVSHRVLLTIHKDRDISVSENVQRDFESRYLEYTLDPEEIARIIYQKSISSVEHQIVLLEKNDNVVWKSQKTWNSKILPLLVPELEETDLWRRHGVIMRTLSGGHKLLVFFKFHPYPFNELGSLTEEEMRAIPYWGAAVFSGLRIFLF